MSCSTTLGWMGCCTVQISHAWLLSRGEGKVACGIGDNRPMPTPTLAALDLPPAEVRALGDRFLDLAVEWLAAEPRSPVLERPSGEALAALLDEPPPQRGMLEDALFEELREKVLRHTPRNGHPRQFAHA